MTKIVEYFLFCVRLFPSSVMLLRFICHFCVVVIAHSLLLMNDNTLQEYTTFYVSTILSMDMWSISSFWKLWIKLVWRFLSNSLELVKLESEFGGSWDRKMFNFVRNGWNFFPKLVVYFIIPLITYYSVTFLALL